MEVGSIRSAFYTLLVASLVVLLVVMWDALLVVL